MADKKYKAYTAQRENVCMRLNDILQIAEQAKDDPTRYNAVKVRCESLNAIVAEFNQTHTAIITLLATAEDPELDNQHKIRKNFDDTYYYIQSIFATLSDSRMLDQSMDRSLSGNSPSHHVRLPKLELKKFNGSLRDWKTFIDMFNSMIHSNKSLANIEKFTYLLSCLEGSPRSLVQCNPLTEANYMIAYNALCERYENKRLIAVNHWREIQNTKKLSSNSDVKVLRELLDIFSEHLAVLKNLGYPVVEWDFILFHMLFDRLDNKTATRFELESGQLLDEAENQNKHYTLLITFLKKQCTALDTVSQSSSQQVNKLFEKEVKPLKRTLFNTKANYSANGYCNLCNQTGHLIYSCPKFQEKSPQERYTIVRSKNWCTNCLGTKHFSYNCSSRSRCSKCFKPHHSLLHYSRSNSPQGSSAVDRSLSPQAENGQSPTVLTNLTHATKPKEILLATAQIRVLDASGNFQSVRALLDSASQINFVTRKCSNRLALTKRPISLSFKGLGNNISDSSQEVTCTLLPRHSLAPRITLDFAVVPQICENLPSSDLFPTHFEEFSHLTLADEKFYISNSVDMLLGADIFGALLREGTLSPNLGKPLALNTCFGWVIMGPISVSSVPNALCSFSATVLEADSLERDIKRLWQLEQVTSVIPESPEDVVAERLFVEGLSRTSSGRYTVQLPFKQSHTALFPGCREIALRRFHTLERKLISHPDLRKQYSEFMLDYLETGHMSLVSSDLLSSCYYIPHHCVLRPESSTTKLRVVFDASAKALNNLSLNDALLVGPKLQQDIFKLLLRFRVHNVVFTADIKQMFRQILIDKSHRKFQRILWRFSPDEQVKDYELNTVTYGITSSPFHAIRVLLELASNYEHKFPLAAKVLRSDIYVDDVLTGAPNVEAALKIQQELFELLALGGFQLRKWTSNRPQLLSHLDDTTIQLNPFSLDQDSSSTIKVLGLQWNPATDSFSYCSNVKLAICTKRTLLSEVARIFDPLGFLTPITLYMKLLIQELWALGLKWDEECPEEIACGFAAFKIEIPELSEVKILRPLQPSNVKFHELHGFCDSSEKAYAAVVYLRTVTLDNIVSTSLVCAKSRVAPLKKISIPRLELCAAVLLANLIEAVKEAYDGILGFSSVFAWSDSTVALCWIKSSPHKWATFVANRVAHIQEIISPEKWMHVATENNPADCATRPITPKQLIGTSKWWAGPSFLTLNCNPCVIQSVGIPDHRLESRNERTVLIVHSSDDHVLDTLINKFSSFSKLLRVISYVMRFGSRRQGNCVFSSNIPSRIEMEKALKNCVKHVQNTSFQQEIKNLSSSTNWKLLPKYLRKLTPFLDKEGVLRVGGRLVHSSLSYDQKHPILLPSDHRFTILLIEYTHKKYLHPGLHATTSLLSQRYWIPSSKRVIKRTLASCVRCFRCQPTSLTPIMGNLPSVRINQIKCFSKCGVDYGGPYSITLGKTRGAKSIKAYICLFVCLATKALHLELASELSTDAFLAALRRFISRRGHITDIYSDCGTNFVGASKVLMQTMHSVSEIEGITWHFNPPAAPNFGGIWEAGIKSVKTHITRVVGTHILTYEEFSTVLTSIEAILNSRPLCAISSDPNDLRSLTPGHFLTVEPVNSFIETDLTETKINRLSRWNLLVRMHQDFWKRWHIEYLHTLNQRSKWLDASKEIERDTLVLVKDSSLPPLSWRLARVIEIHPGSDGVTRVLTLRTSSGTLKRPVSKVCPLPDPN